MVNSVSEVEVWNRERNRLSEYLCETSTSETESIGQDLGSSYAIDSSEAHLSVTVSTLASLPG